MFSRVVTAATKLFTRQSFSEPVQSATFASTFEDKRVVDDIEGLDHIKSDHTHTEPVSMVTATRRSRIVPILKDEAAGADVDSARKRKARAGNTENKDEASKRRRTDTMNQGRIDDVPGELKHDQNTGESVVREIPSSQAEDASEVGDEVSWRPSISTKIQKSATDVSQKIVVTAKETAHIRFGSEEPAALDATNNETQGAANGGNEQHRVDQSESDNDEAPEAIENYTQIRSLKSQTQKVEDARKR